MKRKLANPRNKFGVKTTFLIARLVPKATKQQEYRRCPCTCRVKP